MTDNEIISLRELNLTDQDTSNLERADPRQWGSNRKRACVLMGSAVLQLPIWGTSSLTL